MAASTQLHTAPTTASAPALAAGMALLPACWDANCLQGGRQPSRAHRGSNFLQGRGEAAAMHQAR
jgi:hypothetical protein